MKVALCGKSFIACKSLQYIHDLNVLCNLQLELYVVPNKSDVGLDSWEPSLAKLAQTLGCATAETYQDVDLSEQDILISLQFDKIIKTCHLNGARAYNIHFSDLPRYRGCYPSVIPLRNGENQGGVTLHVLTDGIDNGPIVDQSLFPIYDFTTSYDLYIMYNNTGYNLFKKNIKNLMHNTHISLAQNDKTATYFDKRSVDYSDRNINITDFAVPCIAMRDFIRSCIFPPYQLPLFDGKAICSCDILEWPFDSHDLNMFPDVVINDDRHAVVKCLDGFLRLEFSDEH